MEPKSNRDSKPWWTSDAVVGIEYVLCMGGSITLAIKAGWASSISGVLGALFVGQFLFYFVTLLPQIIGAMWYRVSTSPDERRMRNEARYEELRRLLEQARKDRELQELRSSLPPIRPEDVRPAAYHPPHIEMVHPIPAAESEIPGVYRLGPPAQVTETDFPVRRAYEAVSPYDEDQ